MSIKSITLVFVFFIIIFCIAAFSGCKPANGEPSPAPTPSPSGDDTKLVASDYTRNQNPDVTPAEVDEQVKGNTDFAVDLFQYLVQSNDNLFFSPYSISVALAMTYAGAEGPAKTDMASVLHFNLPDDKLQPAFNKLDLDIMAQSGKRGGPDEQPFTLRSANSLWLQDGYTFQDSFIKLVTENYDAGAEIVDLRGDPAGAADTVNNWIEEQTNDKIKDMLSPDSLSENTLLLLVNAIYFMADWSSKFPDYATRDDAFHLLDGSEITTKMMHQTSWFQCVEGENWQAVKLPYSDGEASMVIILPRENEYTNVEQSLDGNRIREIIDGLAGKVVILSMPKFKLENMFSLSEVLTNMGMGSAFKDGFRSMISGHSDEPVFIEDVLHKAFIDVDENGTEAAAATIVIMAEGDDMEELKFVEFTADRPFIFLIVEESTNTILFMGRVLDPS